MTDDGRHLVDLARAADAAPVFASMQALIDGGERALDRARVLADTAAAAGDHLVPIEIVEFRAPLPVPPQIRDFSLFPTHIRQARRGMRALAPSVLGHPLPGIDNAAPIDFAAGPPAYYLSNRFNVVGHGAVVRWPDWSDRIDFELEIAAILGSGGRDIAPEEAEAHIFGYTIFNDFSARDSQLREMGSMLGPTKSKSFDGANVFGPVIVTRDEVPDIRRLTTRATINGRIWAQDTLAEMMLSFEEVIAFVSRDETLHAGEILGSGTVGNGCGLEHDRYLDVGDVVELEIEKIGVLRNQVVQS